MFFFFFFLERRQKTHTDTHTDTQKKRLLGIINLIYIFFRLFKHKPPDTCSLVPVSHTYRLLAPAKPFQVKMTGLIIVVNGIKVSEKTEMRERGTFPKLRR